MKILYAANIHGDFGQRQDGQNSMLDVLKEYATAQKPDVTILTGNFVKGVFTNDEIEKLKKNAEFLAIKSRFLSITDPATAAQLPPIAAALKGVLSSSLLLMRGAIPREGFDEKRHLESLAKRIAEDQAFPTEPPFTEIKKDAKFIVEAFEKRYYEVDQKVMLQEAVEKMMAQYKTLADVLDDFPDPFSLLPGSADAEYFLQLFEKNNLHCNATSIYGLKIAGYGSAHVGIADLHVPPQLTLDYIEKKTPSGLFLSEPVAHFLKTQPDIVALYMPVHKITIDEERSIYSEALEDYLTEREPILALAGLPHTKRQATFTCNQTVAVYPGALGEGYHSKGGEFCVINVDEKVKEVKEVIFYQIKNRKEVIAQMKCVQKDYKFTEYGLVSERDYDLTHANQKV